MAKNQQGVAIFELILVIAIVAIVAVVGLKVANNRTNLSNESGTASTSQQKTLSTSVTPAPQIKSTADLDKAAAALDANDPASANQSDSSQLDSDSADF
jgi:hypothetical protein